MSEEHEQPPAWSERTAEQYREVVSKHPGVNRIPDQVQPEETKLEELKRLHREGKLTQGIGSQLIAGEVARDAMRERCRRLGALHMLLAKHFYARATAKTPIEIRAADEAIGNLQAELKHAES